MREMGPRPSTQPGNKADCLIINEAGGEKLGVLNDYALHKSTQSLTHSWNRGSGHRTRLTLRTRNVRRTDRDTAPYLVPRYSVASRGKKRWALAYI